MKIILVLVSVQKNHKLYMHNCLKIKFQIRSLIKWLNHHLILVPFLKNHENVNDHHSLQFDRQQHQLNVSCFCLKVQVLRDT